MELKEFIKEAISAIAEATKELQQTYEKDGVVINPPSAQSGSDVFQEDSTNYTFRRVQNVEFDVALTVGEAKGESGKGGLKVFSVELGGSIQKDKSSEQVSRVRFTVPLTLRPSKFEAQHKTLKAQEEARQMAAIQAASGRPRSNSV